MTTAKQTAFCADFIQYDGRRLWFDGNGKITARNGTLALPKPNAFSLVQIDDCPGSTPACRASCYVHGLEKHAKSTHDMYRENSRTIREILALPIPEQVYWELLVGGWISKNCVDFRWHVSGDVFSEDYACFIWQVCRSSPTVRHWIYTRSFDFVPILVRPQNLTVNISADKDNWDAAHAIAEKHQLRLCYMSTDGEVPDLYRGDVIFPDYKLRAVDSLDPFSSPWWASLTPRQRQMVCPVDFQGKSERRRCGPCERCLKK